MKPRRWALIAFFSVAPHLIGISHPLLDYHYHRQVNTAAIAKNYHEDGLPFLHPRVDWAGTNNDVAATELPVYMWLLGAFWGLFGVTDLWGRVLSVLFSALTALCLYEFLKGWLEETAAFWAAVFFAVLPAEVYFGRTVQPEALALFSMVACLWALDRYLLGKGLVWWGVAAVASNMAIGHKLPYAHLLGIAACLCLARKDLKALRDPWLWLFFPASLIGVVAWYRYVASSSIDVLPTSQESYFKLLDYSRVPYYILFQTFSRFPELAATYAGLVFWALGAREVIWRRRLWFFGGWWLCVWFYLVVCGGYTHHHEYTILPMTLVNAALIGAGFAWLRKQTRGWAFAALGALALSVPLHTALRIKHWYHVNFPFLLSIKPAIDQVSAKDDLFLCNQRAASVYLYYIGRRGWSWSVLEVGMRDLEVSINLARNAGAKFFLTEKSQGFEDPSNPYARFFNSRYKLVRDGGNYLIYRL